MKQIINKKVYNTDTAEKLHYYDNECSTSDFNGIAEGLYRTPKGTLFIAGSGGAMTKYSQSFGNNCTSGGANIQPVSIKEAIEWLEEHNGTDCIIEHFRDHIEEA